MKCYRWQDPYGDGPWASDQLAKYLGEWFMQEEPIPLSKVWTGDNSPNMTPPFQNGRALLQFRDKCIDNRALFAYKTLEIEHEYITQEWADIFQSAGLSLVVYEVKEGGYIEDHYQIVFDPYKSKKLKTIRR